MEPADPNLRDFQYALIWLAEKAGYTVDEMLEGLEQVRTRFEGVPEPEPQDELPPSDIVSVDVVDDDAAPLAELPLTALPEEPTTLTLAEDTRVSAVDYERFTDAGGSVEARGRRFFVDSRWGGTGIEPTKEPEN